MMMKPIPEIGDPLDPSRALAIQELAHALVRAGAKGKLIERLCGLTHGKVSKLYRTICGETPPLGVLALGSAKTYAVQTKSTPAGWAIQSAIFLECYQRMGNVVPFAVLRGWRFLASFRSYLRMTDLLAERTGAKRLDINQAYSLLIHAGFLQRPEVADVRLRPCGKCHFQYVVLTGEEMDTQDCPVCSMNSRFKRLSAQAAVAAAAGGRGAKRAGA
jgi:hypothetical protein